MKTVLIFVVNILMFTSTIIGQSLFPGPDYFGLKNDLELKYLKYVNNRASSPRDTIWLPKKLERFFWNGDTLASQPFYYLIYYNDKYDLKSLIYIDANSNDTIMKYELDYNPAGQIEYFTWYNFDNSLNVWLPDYRDYHEYDEWSNISFQLRQNWNTTNHEWRDSLRAIAIFIDSVVIKEFINENFINGHWERYLGFKREFVFNNSNCVTKVYTYDWDVSANTYQHFEFDSLVLNEDCLYSTLIRHRWDSESKKWLNFEKYSDVEYLEYYGYPSHAMNKRVKQKVDWWENEKWEPYQKDSIDYIDSNLNSTFKRWWLWDGISEWIHNMSFRYLCYENGNKQRATRWEYDGQEMVLTYDDSLTWTYYKGSLQEMYRIERDPETLKWHPASKVVYSDFFPFVIPGSGTGSGLDKHPELKIIPNPARNSVKIESEERLRQVTIFNGQGVTVLQKNLSGQEKVVGLNLGKLAPGIYIIKAHTCKGKVLQGKIIVD